jgi:PAS domain S-box-containing protein
LLPDIEKLKVMSPEEVLQLFQKQHTSQINLELQNKALQGAIEKLEDSQERYIDMYHFAPVGYVTLDENGIIVESNFTFTTLIKTSGKSLINKSLACFIFTEDQGSYHLFQDRLFNTGEESVCELRINIADSILCWVCLKGKLSRDKKSGKPEYRIMVNDINKYKQAEEKFRESEQKYRELFDSSRDGFVIVDVKGRFIDANPAYCKMLGYTMDELRQKENFFEITPKQWHDWERQEIWDKQLVQKGRAGLYEKEYRRKDGKVFPVELQSLSVRDEQGKIRYFWAIVRDITERKRAEAATEDAHQRLLTVLDSINAIIYVSDMESYDILFINKHARKIFGDIEGKKCWNMIQSNQSGPCDFCTNPSLVDAGNNPTGIYRWEYQNINTGRWYDCQDRAIKWIDGRIVRLQIGIDITARKRTEEKLRESETRNRTILKAVPDLMFINNREGVFLDYHASDKRLLAVEPEQFLNKCIHEIFPADVAEKILQCFEKAHETQQAQTIEYVLGVMNETRHFEACITPMDDQRQLTIVRDITQRKRDEEAVKESEHKYRTLFEETLNPILVLDENKRYIDANKAALEFLECDREELLYQDVWIFAPPDKLDIMKQNHSPFMSRRTIETEYVVHGATKTLMLNVIPLEIKGTTCLYGIGQDITKHKQVEEVIKASLREKETLLKEVHHRVKNNMQTISSLLNLQILRNKDKNIKQALMDCQGRINSMASVHQMLYTSESLSLIDCQMYISKLSGDILLSYYSSGLNRVKLTIDAKGVTLGIQQALSLGLIINELLSNSLKYGFPENMHGRILIRLKRYEQKKMEFVFSDNGVGIPEDLDWQNTRSLGLNLIVLLAKNQLRGTISMKRREGTSFIIKFNCENN